MSSTFEELGVNKWLVRQCKSMGFLAPTAIQSHCIKPILQGRDCLGCAKTGSGKTAAFAVPILQRLAEDPYGIFCLVLTPTRELAFQIADQFRVLGKPIGLRDAVIVGGMDMMQQSLKLAQRPHIVTATPGRLADHISSTDTFTLKKIKFLVLDEADRLLEKNFSEDLEVIFNALPQKRQTLLFSATLTDAMKELQKLATRKPYFFEVASEVATVEELEQRFVVMPAKVKECYLVYLLQHFHNAEEKSVIIFTPTCRNCQVLSQLLTRLEFPCVALHSLLSQHARLASLAKFKSQQVKILVATDVGSRGLDIPAVQVVINCNIPSSPKDYIHRVGRTARAGRQGLALSLITQYDIDRIHAIEDRIICSIADVKFSHNRKDTKLLEYKVDEAKVLKLIDDIIVTKREIELRLNETSFGERRQVNKRKKQLLQAQLFSGKRKKQDLQARTKSKHLH